MPTTWTTISKPSVTSWTTLPTPPPQIVSGTPIAAGFFLFLTYAGGGQATWTTISKPSGTAWTTISKAT